MLAPSNSNNDHNNESSQDQEQEQELYNVTSAAFNAACTDLIWFGFRGDIREIFGYNFDYPGAVL